jgi:arylformamidase
LRGRIRDISQPIRPGLPVWPGDTEVGFERTWTLGPECPVNVSRLTLSTHAGTHADAPFHYDAEGAGAEALDLSRYIGPCRVIDARGSGPLLLPEHVAASLDGTPPRVLFRTYDAFPRDAWRSDFTAVSHELVDALASLGVVLIGVDAPSLDPEASKDMTAHQAVKRFGLSILEGLVLDDTPPGEYELIALPLALKGLDASPVRAVLRELAP